MKTSVVLSTYNGELYIIEQLNSIKDQTVKTDEVLIFDDVSTDNTFAISEDYIKKNQLDTWHLFQNGKNLGWRKNFIHGLDTAKGDYIFLCDYDDIWNLDKVSKILDAMEENEDIDLLASTYIEMYESSNDDKGRRNNTLNSKTRVIH